MEINSCDSVQYKHAKALAGQETVRKQHRTQRDVPLWALYTYMHFNRLLAWAPCTDSKGEQAISELPSLLLNRG